MMTEPPHEQDNSFIPRSIRADPVPAADHDFKIIIPALNAAGFSNRKIGYLCKDRDGRETAESTIRKWAKGESEPTYYKGRIIVAMFEIYCVSPNDSKR